MADSEALPLNIGINDLLDAGLHFGHQSKRWNPKMKRFIFEKRNGIYIIDLAKSLAQLKLARQFLYATAARGQSILFVGTKRQCQDILKEAALRCGQHYVVNRWLGGTLTNNKNISSSIKHMREIEALDQKGALASMPQKEVSRYRHELVRLQRNLSGLANMTGMPGAIVIIDINREANAVKEANRVGIPVVAITDTNCDPDPIAYPIPGNDDAIRAIKLVVDLLTEAVVKGVSEYSATAAQRKEAEVAKEKTQTVAGETDTRQKRDRRGNRRPRGGAKRSGAEKDHHAAAPAAAEKPAANPPPAASEPAPAQTGAPA